MGLFKTNQNGDKGLKGFIFVNCDVHVRRNGTERQSRTVEGQKSLNVLKSPTAAYRLS